MPPDRMIRRPALDIPAILPDVPAPKIFPETGTKSMDVDLMEEPIQTILLPENARLRGASDDVIPDSSQQTAFRGQEVHGDPVVRWIDWVNEKTVLLSWSDALSGRYGEQIWKKSGAKRSGRCVLSGRWIVRGEPVFRPQGRPRPRNAWAMISADSLAAFARRQSAPDLRSPGEQAARAL